MEGQPDARLLGDRQHRLDEVGVVGPHLLFGDDAVLVVEDRHRRLPAERGRHELAQLRRFVLPLDLGHVELGAAGAAAAGRRRSVRQTEFGMKWKPRTGMPARPTLRGASSGSSRSARRGRAGPASPCGRSASARSRSPRASARAPWSCRPARGCPSPPSTRRPAGSACSSGCPLTPICAAKRSFSSVRSLNWPIATRMPLFCHCRSPCEA